MNAIFVLAVQADACALLRFAFVVGSRVRPLIPKQGRSALRAVDVCGLRITHAGILPYVSDRFKFFHFQYLSDVFK